MDISKLPRLSKTDAPPAAEVPDHGAAHDVPPAGGFEHVVPTSAAAAGYCQCGAPLRTGARFCDSCGAPVAGGSAAVQPVQYVPRDAGVGAEVWLSAIIGAFLLLMGKSFAGWLIAKATGQPYVTGATWAEGNDRGYPADHPVGYWELDGFVALNDSAIFLFGLAMVFEAIVLAFVGTRFRRKVALVTVALAVTVAATGYNLFVGGKLLAAGMMPLWSLLAVAFGGYIAMYEWRLLQQVRGTAGAPDVS